MRFFGKTVVSLDWGLHGPKEGGSFAHSVDHCSSWSVVLRRSVVAARFIRWMEDHKGDESNGEDDKLKKLQFRTAIPDLKLLPVHYAKPQESTIRIIFSSPTNILLPRPFTPTHTHCGGKRPSVTAQSGHHLLSRRRRRETQKEN